MWIYSFCVLSKGQLEQVQLSAPSVVAKNKAVNLTTVLRPSNVGTVTYYWWFDNKTEVGLTFSFSTMQPINRMTRWIHKSQYISISVSVPFSLLWPWTGRCPSPSPWREVTLSPFRLQWATLSIRTKWLWQFMVNHIFLYYITLVFLYLMHLNSKYQT